MWQYRCEVCGRGYINKSSFEKHVKNGHLLVTSVKVDNEYKCSVCNKKFDSLKNLNIHLKVHETGDQPEGVCCALCGVRCAHQYQLRRHRCDALDSRHLLIESVIEGKAGEYKCAVCDKRFNLRNSWKRHMDIHLGMQRFHCPTCGRKYSDNRDLKNHIRTHTGERPFKCSWCPHTFHTKGNLQQHELNCKMRKGVLHVCCICGSSFEEKCKLESHKCGMKPEGSPGQKTNYKCNVCSRSFAFMTALNMHIYSHTATHPHRCFRCGNVFRSRERLKKHRTKERVPAESSLLAGRTRRKHVRNDNVRGIKRPNEDKSLQKRRDIVGNDAGAGGTKKLQVDKHGNGKKWKEQDSYQCPAEGKDVNPVKDATMGASKGDICCSICGEGFVFPSYLNRHRCEALDSELLFKDDAFNKSNRECVVCKKRFFYPQSWQRHMIVHLGLQKHQCHVCNKKYFEERDLKNHMKIHTGDEGPKCGWCSKTYYSKATLSKHEKEVHEKGHHYECGRHFTSIKTLEKHKCMKNHTAHYPYHCSVCGKSFKTRRNMFTHRKRVHCLSGSQSILVDDSKMPDISDRVDESCEEDIIQKSNSRVIPNLGVHCAEKDGDSSPDVYVVTNGGDLQGNDDCTDMPDLSMHCLEENESLPITVPDISARVDESCEDDKIQKSSSRVVSDRSTQCAEKDDGSLTDVYVVTSIGDLSDNDDCTDMPDLTEHCLEENVNSPIMNTAEVDDGHEPCDNSNIPGDEREDCKVAVKALSNDVSSSGESIQGEESYHCSVDGKDQNAGKKETMAMSEGEAKQICCFVCGEGFEGPSLLNRHRCEALDSELLLKDDAFKKSNHECAVCKKKFFYPQSWQRHMIVHLGQQKHKCHVCNKKYFEERHLKDHMKIHTGDEGHKCKWCSKTYYSRAGLIRHEKGVHENGHQCDCGKHFRSIATYRKHVKNHHAPYPYQCSEYGTGFRGRGAFNKHLKGVNCLSGSQKLSEVSKLSNISARVHETCGDNKKQKRTRRVAPDMSMHCAEKDADVYVVTEIGDLKVNDDCTDMLDLMMGLEENDNSPILNTVEVDDVQELCDDSSISDFKMNSVEEVYQCFLCDKKLTTEDALKTHLEIHCT